MAADRPTRRSPPRLSVELNRLTRLSSWFSTGHQFMQFGFVHVVQPFHSPYYSRHCAGCSSSHGEGLREAQVRSVWMCECSAVPHAKDGIESACMHPFLSYTQSLVMHTTTPLSSRARTSCASELAGRGAVARLGAGVAAGPRRSGRRRDCSEHVAGHRWLVGEGLCAPPLGSASHTSSWPDLTLACTRGPLVMGMALCAERNSSDRSCGTR